MVVKILKKIIFSMLLLYTYNVVAASVNMIIPINFINVSIVSVLGIPGLALLMILLRIL